MTIVLRTYIDNDGIIAEIEQDKGCASYRLDINGHYTHERREYYHSIKSAERYLFKHYPTMKKV